ncbi:MAG TPA: phosphoglucosamine mutase [Phycisphaerae bacterium]|nr:phosphoglucosamine mutase [Phycisphaerae bacterium]
MTLMISVSGVRGLVGTTMTPVLAAEMGAAFGSHLGGGAVVIGRDSRTSGEMVQCALVGGLLSTGCDAIELGVVTTPGTAMMIGELRGAGGVVLTASHNPGEWNGIKFLTSAGIAPPPELADRIFARYRAKQFNYAGPDRIGKRSSDASTHERHVAKVLAISNVDAIRKRRPKVVLDSVNGAGGAGGAMLLERLGCDVVRMNYGPTGLFAHTPEPTAENLVTLCDAVKRQGADIGFAQDPDADRLAIVDETGRYIGEEYTVALVAKYLLAKSPGPMAVNLSTSRMIDDLAARAGGAAVVHRTAVGEANVAGVIVENRCIFGGEGNGGVIDPRVVMVRDSFVGMAHVLGLLAEDGRPLSKIVDEIPRYVMVKQKFEMEPAKIIAWLERVRREMDGRVNDADGLRIDWPEGWVHVRPSNTEPIARVIAEASDEGTAKGLAERVADLR